MAAKKRQSAPLLEWVSAALGLVAIAVLLTFVLLNAARRGEKDWPDLVVTAESIRPVASGHVVSFRIENRSGQTAAAVGIEGRVGDETAAVTVDYVPGHSGARGGLMFRSDPRAGVDLRVTGYELP